MEQPTFNRGASPEERRNRYLALKAAFARRAARYPVDWTTTRIRRGWRGADIGCGPPDFLAELARQFGGDLDLVGIDHASDFLDWARADVSQLRQQGELPPSSRISFDCLDIRELDATQVGLFHFAHLCQVFLGHPQEKMEAMWRILRPGGLLFVQDHSIEQCSISPYDPQWTAMIESIQTEYERIHRVRHDGRMIAKRLQEFGFVEVQETMWTLDLPLAENPELLDGIHLLLPEREREAGARFLRRLVQDAATHRTQVYKEWFFVVATKPE
jgi:SAM-dependent methyltransferase